MSSEREVVVSAEAIRSRVSELAAELDAAYPNVKPLLVAILKGSFMFLADLCRALEPEYELDFMSVASYRGPSSSGAVEIRLDLQTNVEGRDVLIVEDIVDTGLTLSYLRNLLLARGAKSVKVVALLFKPGRFQGDIAPEWVGFSVGDAFVVGYGMDLDEMGRLLPDVVKI
jgi:hypoxanthine phosphoribosyltransferase